MSDDNIITVRLRRDRAQFLELNLSTMLQRTWDAMVASNLTDERRQALSRRALVLAAIDDAVRDALLEGGSRANDTAPEMPARPARGAERPRAGSPTVIGAEPVMALSQHAGFYEAASA